MAGSFWRDSNAWWIRAAARMAEGKMNDAYWKEANRRLWCLTWKVAGRKDLDAHDREDLVQHVMMRLTEEEFVARLHGAKVPAHYLAAVMRNRVRSEADEQRATSRESRRYVAERPMREDDRPDREAERNERCDKARFIVMHVLRAKDRRVLTWFYWRHMSVRKIARQLRVSESAVLQRLARARKRFEQEFEK